MKKHTLFKIVAVALCLAMLLSVNAIAAMPGAVEPMALNIQNTDGWIDLLGSGDLKINFYLSSSPTATELGARTIILYESDDNYNYYPTEVYDSNYISSLLGSGRQYGSYVTFDGVAGTYYQAQINFTATTSLGTGTMTYWTECVRAT